MSQLTKSIDINSTQSVSNVDVTLTGGLQSTTDSMLDSWSESLDSLFFYQIAGTVFGITGMFTNGCILFAFFAACKVCMAKKIMNVLLINQLIIDLYSCTMAIPTYILRSFNIYLTGTLGYALCVTFYSEFLWWIGLSASPFGLAVIAVERYVKVVHSIWHKNHSKPWMAFFGCALAWASGFGLNVMSGLLYNVVSNGECIFDSQNFPDLVAYGWITYLYGVQFPFLLFAFCYIRILLTIRRQNSIFPQKVKGPKPKTTASSTTAPATNDSKLSQSEINALKMVSALTVFFAVTWIPAAMLYLVFDVTGGPVILPAYYVCEIFMGFSLTVNPFIYVMGLPDVRDYLYSKVFCRQIFSRNNTVITISSHES